MARRAWVVQSMMAKLGSFVSGPVLRIMSTFKFSTYMMVTLPNEFLCYLGVSNAGWAA